MKEKIASNSERAENKFFAALKRFRTKVRTMFLAEETSLPPMPEKTSVPETTSSTKTKTEQYPSPESNAPSPLYADKQDRIILGKKFPKREPGDWMPEGKLDPAVMREFRVDAPVLSKKQRKELLRKEMNRMENKYPELRGIWNGTASLPDNSENKDGAETA